VARRSIWVPFSQALTAAASTNSKVSLLGNLPIDAAALGGLTVSRIIGNVSFRCDVVAAYQVFSMFLAVHHEDQSQTSMAMNSEAFPGVMWSWLGRTNGALIEVAAGDFDAVEERVYYDIRVQRKIPAQHVLSFIIMNDSGETVTTFVGGRALVKLP